MKKTKKIEVAKKLTPKQKTLPLKKIRTVADVRKFFKHLRFNESLAFHPDDSFECYGIYTIKETKERNKLMEQCFKFCDPSKIANEVFGQSKD